MVAVVLHCNWPIFLALGSKRSTGFDFLTEWYILSLSHKLVPDLKFKFEDIIIFPVLLFLVVLLRLSELFSYS